MKALFHSLFYVITLTITAIVAFFIYVVATTPNAAEINDCLVTRLYKVRLCPKDNTYVRLKDISPVLRHAIIIAEDDAFYTHSGFSWAELKNSFYTNLSRKKFARGGSTITQQLAKNVFLTNDKTILRKIREALLTSQLESLLTKDQILERYLNVIEFGPNLFGIKKAAFHYFGKHPSQLNLLEAAYLAYLLPNPKVHSLTFKKIALTDYSRYRLYDISYKLYRYKKISQSQYITAKSLVPRFPWTDLSETELGQIAGVIDNNNLYQAEESLPEEDIDVENAEISLPPEDAPFDEPPAPEEPNTSDEAPPTTEDIPPAAIELDDSTIVGEDTAPTEGNDSTEQTSPKTDTPFEE